MKISVIIPAYNAEKTIRACVDALLHQAPGDCDLEVVVVDDGSTDATAQIVKTFERVVYVYQPNAGPASARNTGARSASGEVFVFTDSDCVPQPDWLSRLLPYFSDPAISVVAGSYGILNPESLLACCVYREILYRHRHLMGEWVHVFGSYNVAIRRKAFEDLGGFDERYRRASGEDNDLSYRLWQHGLKIRFAKDALVDHLHPERLCRYLYEQFRHGFWRAKMYGDHPRRMMGDGYTFWKDMVEVPLTFIFFAGLIVSVVGYGALWAWIFFAWWLVESVFSGIFRVGGIFRTGYFGAVMVLRAWLRTAGFMSGLLARRHI